MTTSMRTVTAMLLVSAVTGLFSVATAGEPALAYKYDDKQLQWGPCPAFLGEGCSIAVLHGDPATPRTDVFFKVPGDYKIPHHWHTSAERMILVSGNMTVQYDGQKPVLIETGMYAFGPEKHPHVAYCEKGDPCVLFIAFNEPIDAFEIMKPSE
ncbi:cupin domain-containing protein [Sulfurimonas sp. HSL-1656]|uniref:cupin domain-containing protein n=1 Tax=Thiomicrolovo subterrani TaxID=3131934 RepID=UPI0031F8B650